MSANRPPHPEQREDEVFLGNFFSSPFGGALGDAWGRVGWKSKRRGLIAYDVDGNVVPDAFPGFASRAEQEEGMRRYQSGDSSAGGAS